MIGKVPITFQGFPAFPGGVETLLFHWKLFRWLHLLTLILTYTFFQIQTDMEKEYEVGWSVIAVEYNTDTNWNYVLYYVSDYMYARVTSESEYQTDKEVLVFNMAQ